MYKVKKGSKGVNRMLKQFLFLFIALVISTSIAENYLIAGTWQYLFMQSLSLSIIIFFIYHFIVFTVRDKQTDQEKVEQVSSPPQESFNYRLLKKDK